MAAPMTPRVYASAPQAARWLGVSERTMRRLFAADKRLPAAERVFPNGGQFAWGGWWRVPLEDLQAESATPADPTVLHELVAGLAAPALPTRSCATIDQGDRMPTLKQARQVLNTLQSDLPRFVTQLDECRQTEAQLRRERADLDALTLAKTRALAAADLVDELQRDISAAEALVAELQAEADTADAQRRLAEALAEADGARAWVVSEGEALIASLCEGAANTQRALTAWRAASRAAIEAHERLGDPTVPVPRQADLARVVMQVPAAFGQFFPPMFVDGESRRNGTTTVVLLPEVTGLLVAALTSEGARRPIPTQEEETK